MPDPRTPPPVLDSPRLRLRPLRAADAGDVFALYGDPDVTRYWSFETWTRPAQAEAWLAERLTWGPPTVYPWALADRADDRLLGMVSLFVLTGRPHCAELGYSLLPSHQGQGLAREGVRRAVEFAFDTLGLERIEADVDPLNEPSWRLVEKLGFKREGLLRNRWRVRGEFTDSWIYGLLRPDFREAA
jgi:RimJ/RimL family protein N-acetyltransferase